MRVLKQFEFSDPGSNEKIELFPGRTEFKELCLDSLTLLLKKMPAFKSKLILKRTSFKIGVCP